MRAKVSVPSTLTRQVRPGSAKDSGTTVAAARWTIASARAWVRQSAIEAVLNRSSGRVLSASARSGACAPAIRTEAGNAVRKARSRWRPTKPSAPVTRMRPGAFMRGLQRPTPVPFQVGVHHFPDHVLKADLRLPAQHRLGLGAVTQQHVDLGRAQIGLRGAHELFPAQPDMLEGYPAHVAHRGRAAGGDDIVVRSVLLQHQPHGADIVLGVAPVAAGFEIAEFQHVGQAQLYPGGAVGHLAGDELDAAQRALMVEQYAGAGMQAEALAIVHRAPMSIELGDRIG